MDWARRRDSLHRAGERAAALGVLGRARLFRPQGPDRLIRMALLVHRWGLSPAAGYALGSIAFSGAPAIIDERGSVTFNEVEAESNALAAQLRRSGIGPGTKVGVMCRNHRLFVEAVMGIWKVGATCLLVNTAFAGPQLAEVLKREKAEALIHDEEFEPLAGLLGTELKRFWAWHDSPVPAGLTALDVGVPGGEERTSPTPPPGRPRTIILTSGTTGTPKGAGRTAPSSINPAVALLSRIPLRQHERTLIAAPLFHSWGFSHFTFGLLLSSTYILQRRFDAEQTLQAIAEHRPTAMIAVPVMLQRILELPDPVRRKYDLTSLRVVAVSGSAMPGDLASRFMDQYGEVLYNLYGSTEVAWASIATPADLRAAPGTAGKAPWRTVLKILDEAGTEVPPGVTGRIFVGNDFPFEGYTEGGGKTEVGSLLGTGDLGHLDDEGRLFVAGRDDEMIVSGGENVYPREVEDLLAAHPRVADVAVIGVDDRQFGQALKAYVVRRGNLSEKEVQDHVRSNLARFKVPRDVEFVAELPRNATGKILKRELRTKSVPPRPARKPKL
ncbi:MAG: AMP-binding protein [Candidatus Dormibacteraeota bacterium]|nr:AMP-binding protein [Candidatus Dormibacteraeota bacterium]